MTEVFRSLRWDWLWSKARFDTLLALLLLSLSLLSVLGLVRELSLVRMLVPGLAMELSLVRVPVSASVPGLVRELVLGSALVKGSVMGSALAKGLVMGSALAKGSALEYWTQ